jgi:hypothetical protein
LWLADRGLRAIGLARRRMPDMPSPTGRFLPAVAPPPPALPDGAAELVLRAAAALPDRIDWHRGFDPAAHALALRLHRGDGARPTWEASRLGAIPLLAMAARLDRRGGHLARAEALLAEWCEAHPPFRGVAWACGQEAALRALHLALALALLDGDRDPPPAARALLGICARRIAATPLYALAQDNNHPLSEAAGAFACALLLRQDVSRHAAALAARLRRLVAADGGFAQVSPGYARLLLDVLSATEWLRLRHAAPPFDDVVTHRAAALAAWLHRLVEPASGATPPLGLEDGSAFADLGLRGVADARGSTERAARLFAACGADSPGDAGCAWLGLAAPDRALPRPAAWCAEGTMGWHAAQSFALLRTGPLRFRPGQCDLLHLSLRDAEGWLIRDGGTGSYDPPEPWWWAALAGAAAHNAPVFDEADPMPRAGRFLLSHWPVTWQVEHGAATRDARGNVTMRRIRHTDGAWWIEDDVAGPFRTVAWHWRLRPGAWRITANGVEGDAADLVVEADAPLQVTMTEGFESPAYGEIKKVSILRVVAMAPLSRATTRVRLRPIIPIA